MSQTVTTDDKREVMNPYQIRDATGLSLNSVYAMLERGDLPGRKVGGRWLTRRETFERWLDGEEVDPAKKFLKTLKATDTEAPAAQHTR